MHKIKISKKGIIRLKKAIVVTHQVHIDDKFFIVNINNMLRPQAQTCLKVNY